MLKKSSRSPMAGATVSDVYEAVVMKDIGAAADIFRPVYDSLDGSDGFVSLEVSPLLANDTQATIKEAKACGPG